MNTGPLIFGEVLFDRFPDGRSVLGGAPFNVAWNLQALGLRPVLISRVGEDAAGKQVADAMRRWGMDLSGLQSDPERPTGRVDVSLVDGEPSFTIAHLAAWDAIEPPGSHGPSAGLLYHGSLALRGPDSRQTLQSIRAASNLPVFVDVNLRPPWWEREAVLDALHGASWVKLNEEELFELGPTEGSLEARTAAFSERHKPGVLLVTLGARGVMALESGGSPLVRPAAELADVVDTVGAGDALSAVAILGLLSNWPLARLLERGLEFAAAVCGLRGATTIDCGFYRHFTDRWQQKEGHGSDV